MENERGELVDLYIPRKCSATNKIITADDHSSVTISVAKVDENGRLIPGEYEQFAFAGKVRDSAQADAAFNHIAIEAGYINKV